MVAWEGFEDDLAEELAFRATPAYSAYQARFAAWLGSLGIALTPDEFSGRPPRCIVLIPERSCNGTPTASIRVCTRSSGQPSTGATVSGPRTDRPAFPISSSSSSGGAV